jgi:hypothetical protein
VKNKWLYTNLLAVVCLLFSACGDSGSGEDATIVGVLGIGAEYGGIGPDGIALGPTTTVQLSSAGAKYNVTLDDEIDPADIQSSSLYKVCGELGDTIPPTEFVSHPGRKLEVKKIELLKTYSSLDRELIYAARDANLAEIVRLIEAGANAETRTPSYQSPLGELLYAMREAESPTALDSLRTIVRLLLDHQADPDARDNVGFTALHSTARFHPVDMNELLIGAGADVNLRNVFGSTPLHYAVKNGKLENARLLIASGARIDILDEDGKTPLDMTDDSNFLALLMQNLK